MRSGSLRIFPGGGGFLQFVKDGEHAGAAFDGVIEAEVEVRGVFHGNPFGQFALEGSAVVFEHFEHPALLGSGAEGADKNVGLFEVGCDVHPAHRDQGHGERQLAQHQLAEFAFQDFAHPFDTVFHG